MAKYLEFRRDQFGVNGLIPVKRGDHLVLEAQVVDRPPGSLGGSIPVDLSDYDLPATGHFKAEDETDPGEVRVIAETLDAKAGRLALELPASASSLLYLAEEGIGCYVSLKDEDARQFRVDSLGAILSVVDQGFEEP